MSRYVDAHHRADVDALLALVSTDIRIGMPPEPPCHGTEDTKAFFTHVLSERRPGDWKLFPTRANGAPSTANYLRSGGDSVFRATSIDVLSIRDGRIDMIACFLGHHHFPAFELPLTQDA